MMRRCLITMRHAGAPHHATCRQLDQRWPSSMARRAPAIGFIFVTLLIDVIGFGIIIPVLPGLIQSMTGGSVSQAAQYGGWLLAAYAITQFLCAPIVGGLSDRFGR